MIGEPRDDRPTVRFVKLMEQWAPYARWSLFSHFTGEARYNRPSVLVYPNQREVSFPDVPRNFLSIGMSHGNVDSLRDGWHDSVMLRASRIRQHGPVIGTVALAAEFADAEGRPRLRCGRSSGEKSGGVS